MIINCYVRFRMYIIYKWIVCDVYYISELSSYKNKNCE